MKPLRINPALWHYEDELIAAGLSPVAGADEAGRGACAGPMVAAAVVLQEGQRIAGLNDSKKLSPARRDYLYDVILHQALAVCVVRVEVEECDALGMHEADLLGLRRAIMGLERTPSFALTDGFAVPGLPCQSLALHKGDQLSASIAAASILAKVTRDRLMVELDNDYPGYGLASHKGYVTSVHQEALERLGPSPIHRMTYENVRKASRLAT